MQGGDIDNKVVPRLVIVWEGLLGLQTRADAAKCRAQLKLRRWKAAVDTFSLNEPLATALWDITWRLDWRVDLYTFIPGEGFLAALQERVDEDDLPLGRVLYREPQALARRIAYMPDLLAIYHSDPDLGLTFGSKGRFVTADTAPTTIGRV